METKYPPNGKFPPNGMHRGEFAPNRSYAKGWQNGSMWYVTLLGYIMPPLNTPIPTISQCA